MLSRRLLQAVVVIATLGGPLAALAHAAVSGSVTTAPVGVAVPAPAMGIPMMVLLGVMLAAGGAYVLRRRGGMAIAKVAFVATLTALAGLAYANGSITTITLHDAQCGMQVVSPFIPTDQYALASGCPNPIRIISIQADCVDPPGPGPCSEGQVLNYGESCTLPFCF